MSRQTDMDNHANQLNPNNDAYWESRGYNECPNDREDRIPEGGRLSRQQTGGVQRNGKETAAIICLTPASCGPAGVRTTSRSPTMQTKEKPLGSFPTAYGGQIIGSNRWCTTARRWAC